MNNLDKYFERVKKEVQSSSTAWKNKKTNPLDIQEEKVKEKIEYHQSQIARLKLILDEIQDKKKGM